MNRFYIISIFIICVNFSCEKKSKPEPPLVVKEKIIKQFGYTLNDYHVVKDTVKSGDSFGTILEKNNLFYPQIYNIVQKAKQKCTIFLVLELSLLRLFFAEYIEKLLKIITIVLMINAKGSSKSFSQSGLDLLTI